MTAGGNNEKLIAEAISISKIPRENFILSTKTGIDATWKFNHTAEFLQKSVEESLTNLNTT